MRAELALEPDSAAAVELEFPNCHSGPSGNAGTARHSIGWKKRAFKLFWQAL